MSDRTLFLNPLIQSYATPASDAFYSPLSDTFSNTSAFPIDQNRVLSVALNLAQTFVFTPNGIANDTGSVIVAKVIGAARIKTTGLDTDVSTAITGYLPTYGTAVYPGYIILSTYNVSAFEILGQADGTTIELFYGSKEDIVASNIGLVTQTQRLNASGLPLTTATTANVCNSPSSSIVLTAGSYEIRASGKFEQSGAVVTSFLLAISQASATLPASSTFAVPNSSGEFTHYFLANTAMTFTEYTAVIPTYVFVTTTTVNLYLVAQATFASGTSAVNGWIEARKVL